ncbi:MAG: hypothetical protein ACM3WS_03860, partial [Bacillota bacterium]
AMRGGDAAHGDGACVMCTAPLPNLDAKLREEAAQPAAGQAACARRREDARHRAAALVSW